MPYAVVNDVRLYYEERGSGTPILCVHGTSSSALAWARAIPSLTALGRVVAYDRRGCHRSQRPEPYEMTRAGEHADDAHALLRALDAGPAIVIGRSYGGNVALDLALRYPDSVRAIALLEALPAGLDTEADAWSETVCARMTKIASTKGVDAVGEAFVREMVGSWEELPAAWRSMFTSNGQAILAELRGGDLSVDRGTLETIAIPTLVVAGTDSPEAFRRVTAELADAIPHARTAVVAGGHMIDPTDPAVLTWVSEHAGE